MMRKTYLTVLITLLATDFVFAQDKENISREEAWAIIEDEALFKSLDNISVFACDTIVAAGTDIPTYMMPEKAPEFNSWFFFVDENPNASWEHPCKYVYVDTQEGNYVVHDGMRPPIRDKMTRIHFRIKENIYGQVLSSDYGRINGRLKMTDENPLENRHNYAVIINGGLDQYSNYQRYWYDCSYIYSTLINKYHYRKENIFVLMSDGTSPAHDMILNNGSTVSSPLDLDGDGADDIGYAATAANISFVFDSLSNMLTPLDDLFIFTMDHGGQSSGHSVYLYLWNCIMTDTDFAYEVNKVNAKNISVCMGQCHSGGFIDNLESPGRVIMTACRYDETSHTSNFYYDDFVHHWTDAVNNDYGADTDNDGQVSMSEAFAYAVSHDVNTENPQFSSLPSSLGANLCLMNDYSGYIAGSSYIYDDDCLYSVENLPSDYNVTWSLEGDNSSNFNVEIQASDECRISRKDSVEYNLSSNLSLSGLVMHEGLAVDSMYKHIRAPYIDGPSVPCGISAYIVEGRPENSIVEWAATGQNIECYTDPIGIQPVDSFTYVLNSVSSQDARGILMATIRVDNDVVGELHKRIDRGGYLRGTWYQAPALSDSANATPRPFFNRSLLNIVKNRTVYLQSDDFVGATITKTSSGMNVLNWNVNNNVISFFPSILKVNGLGSVTINGTYPNTCRSFSINLTVRQPIQPFDPIILSACPSGTHVDIMLNKENFEKIHSEEKSHSQKSWKLTVVENVTGNVVFESVISDSKVTIGTFDWEPGIYSAVATFEGEKAVGKFIVSK